VRSLIARRIVFVIEFNARIVGLDKMMIDDVGDVSERLSTNETSK
jgi:hypothetical protein